MNMHIGIMIDRERALHEREMWCRIFYGLLDIDDQVTRLLPTDASLDDFDDRCAGLDREQIARLDAIRTIRFEQRVLKWLRKSRAKAIVEECGSSDVPDLFLAIGQESWPVALDVAKMAERPVAVDVWSAEVIDRVPHHRRHESIAAYITPTRSIAEALRQHVDEALIDTVPFGVPIPESPREIFRDDADIRSMAVIGAGKDMASYRLFLQGLSKLLHEFPQTCVFVELRGPGQHEIWRQMEQFGLLDQVSSITDASHFRSLLTQCDCLVVPERFGQMRSLILEAMAAGIAVIAGNDPYLDMLTDGKTAIQVADLTPETWAAALRKVFSAPDFAREIGMGGRAFVRQHHTVPQQVKTLSEICERALHGGAYSITADT